MKFYVCCSTAIVHGGTLSDLFLTCDAKVVNWYPCRSQQDEVADGGLSVPRNLIPHQILNRDTLITKRRYNVGALFRNVVSLWWNWGEPRRAYRPTQDRLEPCRIPKHGEH